MSTISTSSCIGLGVSSALITGCRAAPEEKLQHSEKTYTACAASVQGDIDDSYTSGYDAVIEQDDMLRDACHSPRPYRQSPLEAVGVFVSFGNAWRQGWNFGQISTESNSSLEGMVFVSSATPVLAEYYYGWPPEDWMNEEPPETAELPGKPECDVAVRLEGTYGVEGQVHCVNLPKYEYTERGELVQADGSVEIYYSWIGVGMQPEGS